MAQFECYTVQIILLSLSILINDEVDFWRHSLQIAPGAFMANNYAMGNSLWVVTPLDTIIVFDAPESREAATLIKNDMRQQSAIGNKPITYIVYTIFQGDHTFGAGVRLIIITIIINIIIIINYYYYNDLILLASAGLQTACTNWAGDRSEAGNQLLELRASNNQSSIEGLFIPSSVTSCSNDQYYAQCSVYLSDCIVTTISAFKQHITGRCMPQRHSLQAGMPLCLQPLGPIHIIQQLPTA